MSSDIHALSGAYSLGALDSDERSEFEKHLADCPICRAEVDSLREAAAGLADLTETAPPPGLRERPLADAVELVGRRPRPARSGRPAHDADPARRWDRHRLPVDRARQGSRGGEG